MRRGRRALPHYITDLRLPTYPRIPPTSRKSCGRRSRLRGYINADGGPPAGKHAAIPGDHRSYANRMERLVTDLLRLARLARGRKR